MAEVVLAIKRSKKDTELAYKIILSNSKIFPISPKIAKEGGVLHAEMKKKKNNFSLVDALILISARKAGAKIITLDSHFRGFRESLLLH